MFERVVVCCGNELLLFNISTDFDNIDIYYYHNMKIKKRISKVLFDTMMSCDYYISSYIESNRDRLLLIKSYSSGFFVGSCNLNLYYI